MRETHLPFQCRLNVRVYTAPKGATIYGGAGKPKARLRGNNLELLAVLAVPLSSAHYIRSHFPRKRGQLMGVRHYVSILRFAASRAAGAQLLPRRQPTWWLEAREDREQQNGKEKEQSVWTVLFFGIRQLPTANPTVSFALSH